MSGLGVTLLLTDGLVLVLVSVYGCERTRDLCSRDLCIRGGCDGESGYNPAPLIYMDESTYDSYLTTTTAPLTSCAATVLTPLMSCTADLMTVGLFFSCGALTFHGLVPAPFLYS